MTQPKDLSVGQCPDCGAAIYQSHTRHVCPRVVFESDEGAYTAQISYSFDFHVVRRSDFLPPESK